MRINVDGITVYFPYEFVYPEQYAYMLYRPELAKLVYCTRTVGEMDKVLYELRRVLAHRDKCFAEDAPARAAASRKTLAVGLTTRRNLCLHPAVSSASSREEADALCRSMTAPWARGDPEDIEDVGGRAPRRGTATNGSVVRMTGADEEEEGGAPRALTAAAAAEKGLCEYFEGYDSEGSDAISPLVWSIKTTNADRLADEYARLVQGMSIQGILPANQDDVGRRRNAADVSDAKPPAVLLGAAEEPADHTGSSRRGCFAPLQLVADMATLLGTYGKGQSFALIFEPFDERLPSIPDPVLQLCCLDASLAMKPIFDRFQSVVLTSGTISPRDMYAKVLSFTPVVSRSYSMSLQRNCICPLIVSRGPDQVAISSKFDCRGDKAVVRNYGMLLVQLAEAVPDGIVAFFTSYTYMESILAMWDDMAIIKLLLERKLVFIETPDTIESSLALDNYRRSCDAGRGAIFLCVARGKVAEGIDFDRHYGRAVVMLGVPFQYTESRVLRARLEYMRDNWWHPGG
ncbi:hypothetical protein I4F81_000027 [Pyropia yezoensis]|uniref:Uncharacterized protein n=1 Tax=Pyropia yezoensis TaxID=2788 RepID=A0ACC3BHU7_PYRYE|nr:hypothetical protein I4F81_000027 [Neopyropia yezoensis]